MAPGCQRFLCLHSRHPCLSTCLTLRPQLGQPQQLRSPPPRQAAAARARWPPATRATPSLLSPEFLPCQQMGCTCSCRATTRQSTGQRSCQRAMRKRLPGSTCLAVLIRRSGLLGFCRVLPPLTSTTTRRSPQSTVHRFGLVVVAPAPQRATCLARLLHL